MFQDVTSYVFGFFFPEIALGDGPKNSRIRVKAQKRNFDAYIFRYIDEYCNPNDEKMILFQDDDTVVVEKDFEKFVTSQEFIGRSLDPGITGISGASIVTPFCLETWPIANARVIRPGNRKHTIIEVERWSVPEEIYPKDFYPPYCSGTCYAISSNYAREISKTASRTNPQTFHHDDVLFTGILRVKADIDIPTTVVGICTHYNKITKIQDIRNVVLEYCIKNSILKSHCFIE